MQWVWIARFLWRFCFMWRNSPSRSHASSLLRFVDYTRLDTHADVRTHTHTHTHTPGRTPLNEWPACRKGRCPQNWHKRWTWVPSAEIKLVSLVLELPQTSAWDCTAAVIGPIYIYMCVYIYIYIYIVFTAFVFYYNYLKLRMRNFCCFLYKTRLIVGRINITPIWLHLVSTIFTDFFLFLCVLCAYIMCLLSAVSKPLFNEFWARSHPYVLNSRLVQHPGIYYIREKWSSPRHPGI